MQKKLIDMPSQIEFWAIEKVLPYERNARTHSKEQIDKIARSIGEFGFTNPILVNEEGVIAAGHGRLEAAKKVGMKEVPVIVISGWSKEQLRAYLIADNQLALEAGWDEDLLKLELLSLEEERFDLNLTGLDDAALSKLLLDEQNKNSKVDHESEWQGMPEFVQEDKTAFRTIQVHFKDQEAVEYFKELTGKKITDKTKYVWFPDIEIEQYKDKVYKHEP